MFNIVLRQRAFQFIQLCTRLLCQGRGLAGAVMVLMLAALHSNALAANDAAPNGTPTIPSTMTAGETYPITIMMKNTGTVIWTVAGGYNLVLQNPAGWNVTQIPVAISNVAVNGLRAFNASMVAPSQPGTYSFQWCMAQGGTQFGTCTSPLAITVAPRVQDAAFYSQSMTSTLTTATRAISVSMKNTGNFTWKAGQYSMVTSDATWGITKLTSTAAVAPNAVGTFTGTITAPAPGYYNMQWQMMDPSGQVFGAPSAALNVAVAGGPPTLNVVSPTPNQPIISNANTLTVPIHVEATPTGVATITRIVVETPGNGTNLTLATVNGPVLDQTLKLSGSANTNLIFSTVDSFNKSASKTVTVVSLNDASQLISSTVPTTMVPGHNYDVAITFKNIGGTTWDPQTVTLGAYSTVTSNKWGDIAIPLTAAVAPGGTAVFNATLTAPQTEGSYTFQLRLLESTRSAFGATAGALVTVARPVPLVTMNSPVTGVAGDIATRTTIPVSVAGSATPGTDATISTLEVLDGAAVLATLNTATVDTLFNLPMGTHPIRLRATDNWGKVTLGPIATVTVQSNDAAFVSQSVPATMQAGKTYNAIVTMRNTGNKAWSAAGGFYLGSQNPLNNTIWGPMRVSPAATVGANGQYSFIVPVTAPSTPGTYNFQWQMIQENWEWFGDMSTNVQIVVNPPAPTVGGLTAPATGDKFTAVAGKGDVHLVGSVTPGAGGAISKLEVLDGANPIAQTDGPSIDTVVQLVPGSHSLKMRATDNFGQITTGTVLSTVTVQSNNAALVSRSALPTTMDGGASYPMTIAMRNTGTTTWTAADGYALAPVPDDGTWAPARIPVSGSVAYNATATFTFNVTAPVAGGSYPLQWQMVQQGKESFGATTAAATVAVTNEQPTSTMVTPQPFTVSTVTTTGTVGQVPVQGSAVGVGNTTITKIEVLDFDAPVYTVNGNTINANVPLGLGSHVLRLRATDSRGYTGGSTGASVFVTQVTVPAPTVTLSATPTNLRVAPGQSATITLTGSGVSQGATVTKLEVFVDNGSGYSATPAKTQNGSAAQLVLSDTVSLGNGSYRLKLRATDNNGSTAESNAVQVNITDSPLLGLINGVRSTDAQQLQLAGWVCRDTSVEALNYQVYANAPPALGGTQIANGVANVSGQPDDASVQQQCHTPGTSHHFAIDLTSLQTRYPAAPLYVVATSTHGDTIVLPCDDHGCRMPDAIRIGLTSPGANNQDRFRLPNPVFVRAVVTSFTGTLDEVSFNIDGQWMPGVSEGGGAYSVSKTGLAARVAPYIAYAKVRQGDTTVITSEHQFYVDPGIVPGEVSPKDGTVVTMGQAVVLSTVVNVPVTAGQSVKFFIDPTTAQAKTAQLQRELLVAGPIGAALVAVPVKLAATTMAGSVVGDATFDGSKWVYAWTPTQQGSYTVVAKLLDASGAVLMQTPAATLTVNGGTSGGGTPVAVTVTPPTLPDTDAGTLPGALDVGPGGDASYSIALAVPPGTAGLQPSLALNYSSSGTNGVAGLGWSLSGLSSIHRCGKTIAQDGVNGRINFDHGDRLCIDGQRLVLIGDTPMTDDTYWSDSAVYRTEVDSFMRITAQGSGAARTFKVERKDGKIMTFGDASPTINARVLGYVKLVDGVRQDKTTVRADAQSWAVDKIVDRMGNFITFQYRQSDTTGEHLIDAIRYGGNGLKPHAVVKFGYEDRGDSWTRYIDGTRHDLRQRIAHITTYVGDDMSGAPADNALVRDYALTYETSPTSGRSLLKQVAVSAINPVTGAKDTLPATVFDWGKPDGQKTAGFVSRGIWSGAPILTTHANTGYKSANHPEYFAFQDMENHGLTDVLERRVASPADPAYAENPSTAANPLWPGTMQAQYRYFHNNGNGFDQYVYQLDTHEKFAVLDLGDFDGDGAPDLLVATESGGPKICLSPLRGGLGGIATPITFTCAAATDRPALGANTVTGLPYVVDVMGDGRSAIYGDISAGTNSASLFMQQEKLVDTEPPYAVLPYTDDDRRNTISDSLQAYVSFDQSVDFVGIGKNADVRWALPYHTGVMIGDNGEPIGSPQWVNLAPSVTITDFRRPGTARLGSLRSYWLNAEYPAPACVSGGTPDGNTYYRCDPAPYRFDAPMPTGGAVADFSGSGYSNLMFGFVEITKQLSATRAEATLCLSTGRELDCGKLPQHSGDQYKVAQAIGNFVGDGAPAVLMQETRSGTAADGTKLVPVAVGGLQMCRLTGMGETPSDVTTSCAPWAGLTLPSPASDSTSADQVYFMDLLGTGRPQALYYHAGKFVNNAWQEDGRWEVLESVDVAMDGQALDRIYQVTNGLGAVSSVEYRDGLANGVVTRRGATDLASPYPQRVALSPGKVVRRLRQANGVAGQHATSYRYFDPATDVAGRGALGFGAVESTDEQSQIVTTTSYSHLWPKQGMVRDVSVVTGTGVTLAKTTNTLSFKQFDYNSGGHTYWPYIGESKVERRDLDNSDLGVVTTDNGYDDYGNLKEQHVVSVGDGKTFDGDVVTDFINTDSTWLIGLPKQVTTTRTDPDSGTLTRVVAHEYDTTTGLLNKSTVQPKEQPLELVTEYLRPSQRFGLVEEVRQTWTDPLTQAVRTRSVKTSYDDKGRYPTTVTNAENLTEVYDYVPGTGARKFLSDVNQLATTWDTDGFGRVRKEKRSDGNETDTVLKVCDATHCPDDPDAAMVQLVEHYHGLQRIAVPTLVYSDSVGHVLRTQSYAFDGSATHTKRTYDDRGRLKSTSQPAYATNTTPALASSQEYDDLNRVTVITVLDDAGNNQSTTTHYSGFKTVLTNAKLQSRTDLHNAIGQVWQVTDAMSGVTGFGYDPFGNLSKTVDPRGNVIKIEYDKLGRRLALNDPDLGRIEYTVDALARVRKQSTQVQRDVGQSTETDYDMLDRMTLRKEADLNAGWTYDSALNGKGQLNEAFTFVLDNSTGSYRKDYSRVHSYDRYGRPAGTVKTLSDGSYTSTVSYDDWGRMLMQQYQRNADAVKQFDYRYNDKGYLGSIERNGLKLWSVIKQDAADRPTQVALGNGLTQVKTYNVNSARLTADQLMLGDGTLRLDQGYAFDALGNVAQRTQYWDKNGFIEGFEYDDLNRLKNSTVTGQPQQVFNYFADGSLRNKTGVGTGDYDYQDQGANAVRPHAVKSIAGGMSFSYDNNGNMLTASGMTVIWNSFDMPKMISRNGNSSTFTYGAERQRVRQDRGDGTSIIYADAQEVETSAGSAVTVRTYWPMGIGLEIDVAGQATVLNWIHKDRLGSPVALTAQDGTIAQRLAYDAWGQRRSIGDPMDKFIDHRGFTGHEMLDQLELVHMNGRVYDPVTAKFLSGDPLIQDPMNGQNYNRYSYVLNNPTNLTDPSGFAACDWGRFCLNLFFAEDDINTGKSKEQAKQPVVPQIPQKPTVVAKNIEAGNGTDSADSGIRAGQPASEGCSGEMQCVVVTGKREYPSIKYDGNPRAYFDQLTLAPALKSQRQVIHETLVAKRNNYAHRWLATGRVESQSADMLLLATGIGGVIRSAAVDGVVGAEVGAEADFFAGTRYTDKVIGQMKQGDFHAFPESVTAFQDAGALSKLTGRDGLVRDMLKIPGEYRGKEGNFEFIKEADGSINHRLFRASPGQ